MNERHNQPFSWAGHDPLSWAEHFAPLTRILQLMLDRVYLGPSPTLGYIEHYGSHCVDIDTRSFDFASSVPLITDLAQLVRRLVDKQPVVDLLTWYNKELNYRGLVDPYTLIDALDMFRVSQGLQKDCFTCPEGFFPVSMARLNDLLRDASTKTIALELIGEYQQAYQAYQVDAIDFSLSLSLLKHLVSYLSRNIPSDLEKYPPHLREELNRFAYFETSEWTDEMPYLLTSQEGLSLLRSLNATIHDHSDRLHPWVLSQTRMWVLGLECVAHLNKLPLDYFAVPDSQYPPGTSEAAPSGVVSNASLHDGGDSVGGNGLTGDRKENLSTSIGPSTSGAEEARGETSIGWFD
ncbi:hypothetical protein AAF712_004853 [Marasmius tenuissimus]|uniref:Uncharacterized protein n=1 Tax=Marasmius tenuissimus TaxID=585030 RepID=A0ABR3A5B8_9AGAR